MPTAPKAAIRDLVTNFAFSLGVGTAWSRAFDKANEVLPPQNLKFKDVFRRANTAQLRPAREIYRRLHNGGEFKLAFDTAVLLSHLHSV